MFGATGVVGHQLVGQALAAGHHLTAHVRNPARLNLNHPELTVIAGEGGKGGEGVMRGWG